MNSETLGKRILKATYVLGFATGVFMLPPLTRGQDEVQPASNLQNVYIANRGDSLILNNPYITEVSRTPFGVMAGLSDGPGNDPSVWATGASCLLNPLDAAGELGDFSKGRSVVNTNVTELDVIVVSPAENIVNSRHVSVSLTPVAHLTGGNAAGNSFPCSEPLLSQRTARFISTALGDTKRGLTDLGNFFRR